MTATSLDARLPSLLDALSSRRYTSGSTHGFYLYPARCSPDLARTVIELFSEPGDLVLDPFMGGGTAVVEGLMLGRRVLGVDLNHLACFVAGVRTRPVTRSDEARLRDWARRPAAGAVAVGGVGGSGVKNLPDRLARFLAAALIGTRQLTSARSRSLARCILLRLGQWAVDCREHPTGSERQLSAKLSELTGQFLAGLQELTNACNSVGLRKNRIEAHRRLLCRSAVGLHEDPRAAGALRKVRLVFTSPPYPGVHILYHRWQVHGRRETAAPYWLAGVSDGHFASHYTGGSRTPTGEANYFAMVRSAYSSVAHFMAPGGLVVQLVGFSDTSRQLPKYLEVMADAGFESVSLRDADPQPLRRTVPNRKWYAKLQGPLDAASEVLVIHRLRGVALPRGPVMSWPGSGRGRESESSG